MAFTNPNGYTPLHLAVIQGFLSAVKEILKELRELDLGDGKSILHFAARQGDPSAVKEIVKWGGSGPKQVEELVREYNGSFLSAVPKDCLKTIMLWTGFSAFVSTSFPIAMRGGEKPNWPPVQVFRVVLMFLAVAFHGSFLGLLMVRKLPKLSFYSGYVSLFSLLFALGMIAFFTVMWVFERI